MVPANLKMLTRHVKLLQNEVIERGVNVFINVVLLLTLIWTSAATGAAYVSSEPRAR